MDQKQSLTTIVTEYSQAVGRLVCIEMLRKGSRGRMQPYIQRDPATGRQRVAGIYVQGETEDLRYATGKCITIGSEIIAIENVKWYPSKRDIEETLDKQRGSGLHMPRRYNSVLGVMALCAQQEDMKLVDLVNYYDQSDAKGITTLLRDKLMKADFDWHTHINNNPDCPEARRAERRIKYALTKALTSVEKDQEAISSINKENNIQDRYYLFFNNFMKAVDVQEKKQFRELKEEDPFYILFSSPMLPAGKYPRPDFPTRRAVRFLEDMLKWWGYWWRDQSQDQGDIHDLINRVKEGIKDIPTKIIFKSYTGTVYQKAADAVYYSHEYKSKETFGREFVIDPTVVQQQGIEAASVEAWTRFEAAFRQEHDTNIRGIREAAVDGKVSLRAYHTNTKLFRQAVLPFVDTEASLNECLARWEKDIYEIATTFARQATVLDQTNFVTFYEPNPLSIPKAQVRTFAVFNE